MTDKRQIISIEKMTERSCKVEHDNVKSEGTCKWWEGDSRMQFLIAD